MPRNDAGDPRTGNGGVLFEIRVSGRKTEGIPTT
jgi:hypothetical protein